VPLANPGTTHEPEAPVTVQVAPSGDAVIVKEVGIPPSLGSTTVTVTLPAPAITMGVPGVPGVWGKTVTVAVETRDKLPAASTE
jgi:hypothetical protein